MTNKAYEDKRRQGAHTTYPIGTRHQVWGVGGLRIFRCSLGGLWAGGGDLEGGGSSNQECNQQDANT